MGLYKRLWLIIPVMLMLQGCPGENKYGYKYYIGSFPVNPVNFTEMNTEYDDYNMSAPTLGESVPFVFSSNRNSQGENFDLVYKPFSIVFSKTTGDLFIGAENESHGDWLLKNASLVNGVRKVNSPNDELGPFLVFQDLVYTEDFKDYNSYFLLYANNENGNLDIRFSHNTFKKTWEDPAPVRFLNSEADDAYPTFNGKHSAIYFCSNREGNFDIFKAITDPDIGTLDILESGDSITVEKDTTLSSDGDDKCPYIAYSDDIYFGPGDSNSLLVFTSNREGGYGGYDLYYSKLVYGEWSEPRNFGAAINTEYDEYRPIVRPQGDFTNDIMLFSSNRPGGLGGFDLYYVGIKNIGFQN